MSMPIIDDEFRANFDWNAQSLFSTPLGLEVQLVTSAILTGKHEQTSVYAQYMKAINDVLFALSQSFWDIDMTIKLIEFAHPKIKSFKMTRVDRGDYLKYLFENYFFRLPKLKDIVLQLLNVVFQMGHTQSSGLEKRIRKNPAITGKFDFYLDFFDQAFQIIAPIRHRIAHRGDLEDSTLAFLSTYQLLPYDQELYHTQLKGIISYTYFFEKHQAEFKKIVIAMIMQLKDDFDNISGSLSKTP